MKKLCLVIGVLLFLVLTSAENISRLDGMRVLGKNYVTVNVTATSFTPNVTGYCFIINGSNTDVYFNPTGNIATLSDCKIPANSYLDTYPVYFRSIETISFITAATTNIVVWEYDYNR